MSKKKKKFKRKQELDITGKVADLVFDLGLGKTLEEVARDRGIYFSDFIAEINDNPRLIQAVKDGKSKGYAFWQTRLKKLMIRKDVNSSLVRDWMGNYMNWWSSPLPQAFDENTTVIINVELHKPKKKQQKLIDENI